tara:strand:+ start:5221 stop:8064 length:2844 start_codon:yes stop_codon:yes gene_type:complete
MDRPPRKLRIVDNPTVLQRRILRQTFGGRRYSRDQYIQLRLRYNEQLPQLRQQFRLRQRNIGRIQDRAARVIQRARDRRGGQTFIPRGDNVFQYKEWLRNFRGQTVKVYSMIDGVIIDEQLVEIPLNGFNAWWDNVGSYSFLIGPSGEQRTPITDGANKVVITPNINLQPNRVEQLFREGIKHCVFQPILDWGQEQFETVKSRASHFRYKGFIKKCNEYIEKYQNGVPEKDLQDICNRLQINIVIDFPLDKQNFLSFKSLKSGIHTFKFVNTRLNHIDVNEVINKQFIEMESDDFDELVEELTEKGEYFDYRKDMENNYIKIRTLKGNYSKKNEFLDLCSDFENQSGIVECKIDGIQDWELWNFCNEGNKTTGTQQYLDWNSEVEHIDMKYAYSNFHLCSEYEGFVGKITDFRKVCNPKDFQKLIGYFNVSKIDSSKCKVPELFNKLNYLKEHQIYPSVELKKWESLGVDIEVDEGCWGTKLDFRFSEEMLKKVDDDETNPRGYSKWCGIAEKVTDRQSFQMKGDKEFFENMKSYLEDTNTEIKWFDDGEGTISYPKEHCYGSVHIVGFIKMYQRLTLINQLLELDISKLIGVCVDGVFYNPHKFKMIEPFREKGLGGGLKHSSCNLTNKVGCEDDDEFDIVYYPHTESEPREYFQKELFLGAGGNGKTHKNLMDKGLVRPIYIAPSWKLCSSKYNDYNCPNEVLSNLLHPKKINFYRNIYNTIIIDECSQISNNTKDTILQTYPNSRVIFCGDLGYQLPPTGKTPEEKQEMNLDGFDNVIELTHNYRILCDKQKDICEKVRTMIKEKKPKNLINQFICESYENIEIPVGYKPEDIILCSKTRCIKHQKEDCNCDGQNYCLEYTKKFGKNKWKCLERSYTHSRGDISVGEKPENGKWENRHGYTIHSVQGETFKETIFIDGRNLFDERMGYTAISRARYHHQIKIII